MDLSTEAAPVPGLRRHPPARQLQSTPGRSPRAHSWSNAVALGWRGRQRRRRGRGRWVTWQWTRADGCIAVGVCIWVRDFAEGILGVGVSHYAMCPVSNVCHPYVIKQLCQHLCSMRSIMSPCSDTSTDMSTNMSCSSFKLRSSLRMSSCRSRISLSACVHFNTRV